jgi:uncharacterized repeat protein (TIGR04138 family)
MSTLGISENQIKIKLYELSDSLGYSMETIEWVYFGINQMSVCGTGSPEERSHISAKTVCVGLLRDLVSLYNEPLEDSLKSIKINSSEDIGRIVYGLVEKGLISAAADESISDFENLFNIGNIKDFQKNENIQNKIMDSHRTYRFVMWLLYIVGFILVAASYIDLVNHKIAWFGWIIAMVGFSMQYNKPPEKKRF